MRVLALVAIVAGIILFIFGINSTDKPVDKVVEKTTGRFTDKTMWFIIGGMVLVVGGVALGAKSRR